MGGMKPLACLTCGPSFEPIDEVRRITNFSTGEIGAHLQNALERAGAETICFRGEGATAERPRGDVREFTTNASLATSIQGLERTPDFIFHAAALSDFVVREIDGAFGAKLDSRSGDVRLTLSPASKLLPQLRGWFPNAVIVGWKYELDGDRERALACGAAQIVAARTDACVVNGRAFGDGFGLLWPDSRVETFPDKITLATALADRFVR